MSGLFNIGVVVTASPSTGDAQFLVLFVRSGVSSPGCSTWHSWAIRFICYEKSKGFIVGNNHAFNSIKKKFGLSKTNLLPFPIALMRPCPLNVLKHQANTKISGTVRQNFVRKGLLSGNLISSSIVILQCVARMSLTWTADHRRKHAAFRNHCPAGLMMSAFFHRWRRRQTQCLPSASRFPNPDMSITLAIIKFPHLEHGKPFS